MAKRILNRRELRADFEAAERSKEGAEDVEDTEEDEEEEEAEGEDEGEAEEEASAEEAEAEPEKKAPAPKKRKAEPKAPKPRSRSRAQKIVRQKVVWAVFNNSNQRVQSFEYPRKQEAYDLAAKLTADKKSTHFVQPVKEPIEEKKE